jgi:hypothetical protein
MPLFWMALLPKPTAYSTLSTNLRGRIGRPLLREGDPAPSISKEELMVAEYPLLGGCAPFQPGFCFGRSCLSPSIPLGGTGSPGARRGTNDIFNRKRFTILVNLWNDPARLGTDRAGRGSGGHRPDASGPFNRIPLRSSGSIAAQALFTG